MDEDATTTGDIDNALVMDFVESCGERMKETSVNTCMRAIRAFYYCMDLGYIQRFKIVIRKAEKSVKETYSDDELMLLLKKPNTKKCDFPEFRGWVLVNYLLSTGNRLRTVINVKIKDIDFASETIFLRHLKNRKQYSIPLNPSLVKVLRKYLTFRGGNPDEYLFCNVTGGQLTKSAIQKALVKYNTSKGVHKTSIHLFRHTFAKKWILGGGDPFKLQKILGHSSLDMVKEYIAMFTDDLRQGYDRINPLEQMGLYKERIQCQLK